MIQLKGGRTATDPRLDRVPQFDEKSRGYEIRGMLGEDAQIKTKSWPCGPRLNQGREGACVGFGWSHELAAWPYVVTKVDNPFAQAVYYEARRIDEWPGENYSGTSVLAGAKVIRSKGYMDEFRWAFGVDDALKTVSNYGPVVAGTDWHEGMFRPDPSGLLRVEGSVAGGHCFAIRGVLPNYRLKGHDKRMDLVRCRNSWGINWGVKGDFYLTFEDLDKLLKAWGEACVPVVRRSKAKMAAAAMLGSKG